MQRDTWFKIVGSFTIVGSIAAMLVVPEVRRLIGLESQASQQALGAGQSANPSQPPSQPGQSPLTLSDALQRYRYEHGWTGGKANSADPAKASYFPVTEVSVNGNVVSMKYSWKNGILRGVTAGRKFVGTWKQSTDFLAEGEMVLDFDESFSKAEGWWKDSHSGEQGAAFLRRKD